MSLTEKAFFIIFQKETDPSVLLLYALVFVVIAIIGTGLMLLRQKADHFILVQIHLTGVGIPILIIIVEYAIVTARAAAFLVHTVPPPRVVASIISYFVGKVNALVKIMK